MGIFRYILCGLTFFVAVGLGGCSQDDQSSQDIVSVEKTEEVVAPSTENKLPVLIPFEQTKVETLPKSDSAYQKPGASVRFSHNYDGQSDVGGFEAVILTFNHAYASGTLNIQLEAQEGLNVAENSSPYTFALGDSQTIEIEALLSADSEGKYYLSIFATVDDLNINPISRVFALAFNVGELGKTAKSNMEPIHMSVEETPAKNQVIMMPAEETISQ